MRDTRVVVGKLLASIVIVVCLGAQIQAAARPDDARLFPFLSYPMYSRSRGPGETIRVRDLWARTCDDGQRSWKVDPRELGYQDKHSIGEFSAIAHDRPGALTQRTHLSALARARLTPRPCVLQLRERAVPTTRDGVDASALRDSRGILLREWSVDDPGAVRAFSAR
ncbi:MAG: hypothetical protein ACYC2G_01860 [Gemmatimonadaceae bacterium]